MRPTRAYVGLGSNLEEPVRQLLAAFDELAALPGTHLVARSRLYGSTPVGPAGQPDYVNAVAALDTTLSPDDLLDALFAIEQAHARVRVERWGPRTLDLDLLLHGDAVVATGRLTLPHPRLRERGFVLVPLHEIAPGLVLPDETPLSVLVQACPPGGLWPLDEPAPGP